MQEAADTQLSARGLKKEKSKATATITLRI